MLKVANTNDLLGKALWLRQTLLRMAVKAGRSHLSSCFSCADILVGLYYGGLVSHDPGDPRHPDRDRVIMSKGHAAAALYPILADLGYFPMEHLDRFDQVGESLGLFASPSVPGIEAVSDSLGHGLGIGVGMAYAIKMAKSKSRVFVILGDGECCEGSVWEAADVASRFELNNLFAVVDDNGLSVLGKTQLNIHMKFMSSGWSCMKIDGHRIDSFVQDMRGIVAVAGAGDRPTAIIAKTVKGKGLSFMEGDHTWHNKPMTQQQVQVAAEELHPLRSVELGGVPKGFGLISGGGDLS